MERVENAIRRVAWRFRRGLNLRNQTISPIQWLPGADVSGPSTTFINGLAQEPRNRIDHLTREVKLFSRLLPLFPQRRLSDDDWRSLFECESRKQRMDQIIFLRKRELLKQNDVAKKEERRQKAVLDGDTWDHNRENWLFNWNMASIAAAERRAAGCRLASAHRLGGPSLAVDCRFLPLLSPRGADLTAVQLQYMGAANRDRRDPWPLYFVNFDDRQERVAKLQQKHLSTVSSKYTCGPVTSRENYTQLAPKEKIVYLSPHADEELTEVNDDEVYVLGGIVDRVPEKAIDRHASRVAAEADGVRTLRLPLDSYVKWESGTKFLTLVAVMKILQDVHANGGDWEAALRSNIPVRNVRPVKEKNASSREKHERIRQFNREILEIVQNRMENS